VPELSKLLEEVETTFGLHRRINCLERDELGFEKEVKKKKKITFFFLFLLKLEANRKIICKSSKFKKK